MLVTWELGLDVIDGHWGTIWLWIKFYNKAGRKGLKERSKQSTRAPGGRGFRFS